MTEQAAGTSGPPVAPVAGTLHPFSPSSSTVDRDLRFFVRQGAPAAGPPRRWLGG